MDSVLNTVKRLLGINDVTAFDDELAIQINSVIYILKQMGVSCDYISGSTDTWATRFPNLDCEPIKMFIALKVKKVFDSPASNVMNAIDDRLKELEYRIYIDVDNEELT